MSDGSIRWKRGDYVRLGRAVSDFNKKIRKVRTIENELYLPEELNYSDVKNDILTRSELNRIINSLNRFKQEGAEELYETDAGEQLTNWERNELRINQRTARRRLATEIKEYNEEPLKHDSKYTRAQMGSTVLQEMVDTFNNLGKIEKLTGYEFQSLRNRLKRRGRSDYSFRRAINYKEKYIEVMEKYKDFDNYDKLKEAFNKLSNPNDFYDFIKKANNENIKDLQYQSDQYFTQAAFNSFLQDLGILDGDNELVSDFQEFKHETYVQNKKKYKYKLVTKSGKVIARSNNRQELIQIIKNSKDEEIRKAIIMFNN